MISGRRESVIRHINNPRIHAGRALAVPYVEFISRFKNGTPFKFCLRVSLEDQDYAQTTNGRGDIV